GTDNGTVGNVLIEHWDGSAWTLQVGPQPGGLPPRLYGVTAVSATDVWAVGGGPYGDTFIDHFDGSAWSIVPSPSVSGALYGVAAVAPNDVWAVGGAGHTFIEHWDGTQWSIVPSPNPGATTNHL